MTTRGRLVRLGHGTRATGAPAALSWTATGAVFWGATNGATRCVSGAPSGAATGAAPGPGKTVVFSRRCFFSVAGSLMAFWPAPSDAMMVLPRRVTWPAIDHALRRRVTR